MENQNNTSLRLSLAAIVLLGVSAPAMALWGDRLELFVAENITSDSNIFRVSDANAAGLLGSNSKGDTYTTTTAGFNFDVPVSRQRFQAGASLNRTHFGRYSELDYTGHEAHAAWLWQAGNDVSGQLGYTESKALASFTNILDTATSRRAFVNPLTVQRAYGTAAYAITPSWRLQGGLSDTKQRNGNLLRQANDVDFTDGDVTLNYVTAAGNSVGLGVRQQDGRYPNLQTVPGLGLIRNDYVQRGVGLVADWTPTGKSHFNGRIEHLRRNYDQLSQRDYEGTALRGTYDWKPTGKLTITAVAQRDISSSEDIQTSFVLLKGFAVRPSLELSDKMTLSGNVDYSIRDYLGDPGLTLGAAGRSDRVQTLGATLAYRPLRTVTLQLSAQHESRSSNVPLADYQVNVISINGRLSF